MPKEVIYDAIGMVNDSGREEVIAEVTWGKDAEQVQLATLMVAPSTHTRYTKEVEGGWFLNLDRGKINQLIRVLRRARDQAYGSDE